MALWKSGGGRSLKQTYQRGAAAGLPVARLARVRKPAPADHPIHPLLAERWSPRTFADRPVDDADLLALLEAARWAPSCFNEQPWAFLVARREDGDAFERMAACLTPGNRRWAPGAAVLVISLAKKRFDRNEKPNRHAFHDVGLAAMSLTVEATARGLHVHQMAGIDRERIVETYGVPEGWEPVAGIALGHPGGDPDALPDDLPERERRERRRKALPEFVFGERWGEPSPLVADVEPCESGVGDDAPEGSGGA